MVLHLSKMACEIMIWYWQMSIPDFYLQKRRCIRSSRLRKLYHFKYIQPSLIAVLCEEKLALIGYRSLIYLLLLNFHPQVGSCIFVRTNFTYFGLRFLNSR